jgi:Tol biopolymer transport system component
MVLLQSRSCLGSMNQGPALLFRQHLTRRRAIAMALTGALAMPHRSHGQTKKLTLAVPDLVSSFSDSGNIAHLAAALVSDDLRGTGQFAPLDSSVLSTASATGIAPSGLPRFETWRAIGVDALVTGSMGPAGERLKFEFHLWDVRSGLQLAGQQYISHADDWRRIGHAVSGDVYERLTGKTRDFASDRN